MSETELLIEAILKKVRMFQNLLFYCLKRKRKFTFLAYLTVMIVLGSMSGVWCNLFSLLKLLDMSFSSYISQI